MNLYIRFCGHIAVVCLSTLALRADQKTLTEYSVGENSKTRVRLFQKDKMQRSEMNDRQAMILRPDAYIYLDLEKKTFRRTPIGTAEPAVAGPNTGGAATSSAEEKGGIVKTRVSVEDTGERKQMFGYEARRLKMRTEMVAGPDTCHPGEMKMETDGWYIDLKDRPDAQTDSAQAAVANPGGDCKDDYQAEYSGSGKAGFPIEYLSKTWQNGQGPQVTSMKVLEFSEETLSPALFEVPEGFTDMRSAPTTAPADTAAAGTITVGVAPVVHGPAGSNATLAAVLMSESVQSMALGDASIESAKTAGAAYLLTSEQVSQQPKKRGGMFGKLSQALGGKEVELRYTLVAVKDGKELLKSSAVAKSSGAGLGAALGIAQTAAPLAGTGNGGRVAQGVIQTAALTAINGSANLSPVAGLLGRHSYAAYSGMMDPNLQSLAYMGRYAPEMAAAQAAGMAVGAAVPDAPARSSAASGSDRPLDDAMRQIATAVRERLNGVQ